jgi:PAS domain S-box-containing protein
MHGLIIEVNDEFLRIVGYSREELFKEQMRWSDLTPVEYHSRDKEALMYARENGNCAPYEKQCIRKDGSRIWVLIGYAVVGQDGEEAVAFVLDISKTKETEERVMSLNQELEARVIERTNQLQFINEELLVEVDERKSAEKRLQEALSVLSATLESTADGILVVDSRRNIAVYNRLFADMWQIPDSVLRTKDERAVLREQALRVRDHDAFCKRMDEIYQNPELDTFDVVELSNDRIFERISKPQRIGYTIVGRVFNFRDVTRQKEMEAEIERALREKETLLKEIHHRMKNNMQVVSSLLFMQSRTCDDPHLKEILRESQNRVKSIALVHEELYQSMDLDRIDYTRYLRKIVRNIFDTYKVSPDQISLQFSEERVYLTISKAVPCSLIVNELISNSIKHACPDKRPGTISIECGVEDGRFILRYADDGVGFPPNISLRSPKTLGLELIQGLVKQLGGTIAIFHEKGTQYEISFDQ